MKATTAPGFGRRGWRQPSSRAPGRRCVPCRDMRQQGDERQVGGNDEGGRPPAARRAVEKMDGAQVQRNDRGKEPAPAGGRFRSRGRRRPTPRGARLNAPGNAHCRSCASSGASPRRSVSPAGAACAGLLPGGRPTPPLPQSASLRPAAPSGCRAWLGGALPAGRALTAALMPHGFYGPDAATVPICRPAKRSNRLARGFSAARLSRDPAAPRPQEVCSGPA